MLVQNLYINASILLYLYMTVYNMTLLGIFWVLLSTFIRDFKTLYSFSVFGFNSSYLFFLTLFLFSMAGVPPFLGFFTKLFIINLLSSGNFFTLYFLLFIILFFGLYFYIQNLRFLHSTRLRSNSKPFLKNTRVPLFSYYYLLVLSFFLVNGVFLADEFILIFCWLLY